MAEEPIASHARISSVVKTHVVGLGYKPETIWKTYFGDDYEPPCTLFNFERHVFTLTDSNEHRITSLRPVYTHQPSCNGGEPEESRVFETEITQRDENPTLSDYVAMGLFVKAVDNINGNCDVPIHVGFKVNGRVRSACTAHYDGGTCTVYVRKGDGIQFQNEGMMCNFVVPKYDIYNVPTDSHELMRDYSIENLHKMKIREKKDYTEPALSTVEWNENKYTYLRNCRAYTITMGDEQRAIFSKTLDELFSTFDLLCKEIGRTPSNEKYLNMTLEHPVTIPAMGIRALTQEEIDVLKRCRYVFSITSPIVEIVTTYNAQKPETDFPDDIEPVSTNESESEFYASVWVVKRALSARTASLERERFNYNLHSIENIVVQAGDLKGHKFSTTVEIGLLYAPRKYCLQDMPPTNDVTIHPIPQGFYAHDLSLELPL